MALSGQHSRVLYPQAQPRCCWRRLRLCPTHFTREGAQDLVGPKTSDQRSGATGTRGGQEEGWGGRHPLKTNYKLCQLREEGARESQSQKMCCVPPASAEGGTGMNSGDRSPQCFLLPTWLSYLTSPKSLPSGPASGRRTLQKEVSHFLRAGPLDHCRLCALLQSCSPAAQVSCLALAAALDRSGTRLGPSASSL